MRNCYALLGVSRSASMAEIQAAFRRLAMQWHPDRNRRPDAATRFRAINEAYQCLRDPVTRYAHDAAIRRAEAAARGPDSGGARGDDAAADLWAVLNEKLTLRPDLLLATFARIDAWLQHLFVRAARRDGRHSPK